MSTKVRKRIKEVKNPLNGYRSWAYFCPMRQTTDIMRLVHNAIRTVLNANGQSSIAIQYSRTNVSDLDKYVYIDIGGADRTGSQSDLSYDYTITTGVIFYETSPAYSVTNHNTLIDLVYKAFQDTTLTGEIHTEARTLDLELESVSDLGASKEQTRSDDGRYIVRYLMDFNLRMNLTAS